MELFYGELGGQGWCVAVANGDLQRTVCVERRLSAIASAMRQPLGPLAGDELVFQHP